VTSVGFRDALKVATEATEAAEAKLHREIAERIMNRPS
jgi:hypothetical protein